MRGREPADTAASAARTATTEGAAAGTPVVAVPVAVRATGPAAAAARTRGTGRDRGEGGGRGAGRGGRGWVGSFIRFVVCGGGVSLLSSAVLLAVSGTVPFALANAVVTVASTLLATELHHRVTFAVRGTATGTGASGTGVTGTGVAGTGAPGWAGWRIHAKSALTLVVAYLFTTVAVLALGAAHPHAGPLLTQAVYLSASGLAGTGRFLVLRLVVFARGPRHPEPPAARELHQGTVTVAA